MFMFDVFESSDLGFGGLQVSSVGLCCPAINDLRY